METLRTELIHPSVTLQMILYGPTLPSDQRGLFVIFFENLSFAPAHKNTLHSLYQHAFLVFLVLVLRLILVKYVVQLKLNY